MIPRPHPRAWPYAGEGERGSALMLVPAGVLVLLLLGAIAVDSSIAFMAQRELQNAAAAAANDAAAVAVDPSDISTKGSAATANAATADRLVRERFQQDLAYGLTVTDVSDDVQGNQVTVVVHGNVRYLFARAIPGAAHSQEIVVKASAQLQHQ